jgi:hypothetical protein
MFVSRLLYPIQVTYSALSTFWSGSTSILLAPPTAGLPYNRPSTNQLKSTAFDEANIYFSTKHGTPMRRYTVLT